MGYAKHVGRVGALAIALGVGVGIGAAPAEAWADTASADSSAADHTATSKRQNNSPQSPGSDAGAAGEEAGAAADERDGDETDAEQNADEGDDVEDEVANGGNGHVTESEQSGRHRRSKAGAERVAQNESIARSAETNEPPAARKFEANEVPTSAPSPGPAEARAVEAPTATVAVEPSPIADLPSETATVSLPSEQTGLAGSTTTPVLPVVSPALLVMFGAARREQGRVSTSESAALPAAALPTATPTVGRPGLFTGRVTGRLNATDPDGDPLTYTAPAPSDKGTVTVTSRGSFTFTPTAAARHAAAATDATAADKQHTFTVQISDGTGNVVGVPVTVDIRPANSTPTRVRSTVDGVDAVSGEVTGRITARDSDGDALGFTATTPGDGVVEVRPDGTFTYTPSVDAREKARDTWYTDTDRFRVTVNDGHGGTRTVAVSVKIAPANTAPRAGTPTFQAPNTATGAIKGSVNAVDPEGDSVRYSGTADTPLGRVVVERNGSFTYTPTAAARHAASAPGGTKTDTFEVEAADSYGAITTTVVSVTIDPKNAKPTATATAGQPNADGVVAGKVTAVDADGDTITFSAPASTLRGTVTIDAAGNFTYKPSDEARRAAAVVNAPATAKSDTFVVTMQDGHGGIGTVPIVVTIAPLPNTAPSNASYTISNANTGTGVVEGTVTATDADNDSLTFAGTQTTAKGSVVVNPDGTFAYKPTDAARLTAASPTATAADKRDTFTVTITDGRGPTGVITTVVAVEVLPLPTGANLAPVQTAPTTVYQPEFGRVSGKINVTDPNGDTLIYTFEPIGSNSSWEDGGFEVDDATGTWTFIPTAERRHEAAAEAGGRPDTFTFRWTADDGRGGTVQGDVTVPIQGFSTPPVFSGASPTTRDQATGAILGTFNVTDPEGDWLEVVAETVPGLGQASVHWVGGSTFQWRYLPSATADPEAEHHIHFVASDGHGNEGYFSLWAVNLDSPAATGSPATPSGGASTKPSNPTTGAISGVVSVNGSPGGTLSYSVTTTPGKGSVTVDPTTGAYTYTPRTEARTGAANSGATTGDKTDTFTVTVRNANGQQVAVVPITVPISPVDSRPAITVKVEKPNPYTGQVRGKVTAIDPDGDAVTFTANGSKTALGTLQIDSSDGTFVYTPSAAARILASERAGVRDVFFVSVRESNGRVTHRPIQVSVAPAEFVTGPVDPTVPPPPPDEPDAPRPITLDEVMFLPGWVHISDWQYRVEMDVSRSDYYNITLFDTETVTYRTQDGYTNSYTTEYAAVSQDVTYKLNFKNNAYDVYLIEYAYGYTGFTGPGGEPLQTQYVTAFRKLETGQEVQVTNFDTIETGFQWQVRNEFPAGFREHYSFNLDRFTVHPLSDFVFDLEDQRKDQIYYGHDYNYPDPNRPLHGYDSMFVVFRAGTFPESVFPMREPVDPFDPTFEIPLQQLQEQSWEMQRGFCAAGSGAFRLAEFAIMHRPTFGANVKIKGIFKPKKIADGITSTTKQQFEAAYDDLDALWSSCDNIPNDSDNDN
ncbi:Ig-like domain-containing protein [Mycolicibacterium iranicum]|uniref:Ig-like domain-containing protein n=1 Tax=Mycolicibacterium iranicum TaxID=912594 RepID=A0ABT4HCT9_MYCIR|nr:Ig-like domain-containing protein [Mycolicibacterium iranicum]MCZ0727977.1 Ig-like domain-containing protein [Mycolicibacterium iranicum]